MFLAELYGRNLQSPGWSKVPRLLDKSGLYDLGMCLELKVEPHTSMSRVCSGRMHDINFYASLFQLLKTEKRGGACSGNLFQKECKLPLESWQMQAFLV